jgi:hypothetical protein
MRKAYFTRRLIIDRSGNDAKAEGREGERLKTEGVKAQGMVSRNRPSISRRPAGISKKASRAGEATPGTKA